MAYPTPLALSDFCLDWGLFCLVPQLFVGDNFRPSDVENVPGASVGKCLQFVGAGLGYTPHFQTVEQDRLHIGVKDPNLVAEGESC